MSKPYFTPARCTAEIPQSSDPSRCDAIVCNALADLIVEEGPRCQSCFDTYGGTPLTSPVCELCGRDPVCCPCVVAGLTAKAEATVNYERWRKENGGAL